MARRHPPPDPELAALARDRLARLLGGGATGPRRAAGVLEADVDDEEQRVALHEGPASSGPGRPPGPEDLEPPRRFTRWHLGVVAAVLLVGLVWGGWSWVRARPEAVAAPSVVQSQAPAGTPTSPVPGSSSGAPTSSGAGTATAGGGATASGAETAPGPVVHVLGAVRHPGLVRLAAGARVEDAIEAAGGLRRDADPDELNLARPLEDGEQVVVGTRSHPAGEVRSGGGGGSGGANGASSTGSGSGTESGSRASAGGGAVVDLNRANAGQLEALPGVGPVTAQKILDWREQHGRFSGVEELQEVDGIGPKTYARLAPHVRV